MLSINIVLVLATLLAYTLPFLAPKWFPLLSVLTLFLPFFLVLNLGFFFYWFLQFKKYIFVSGIVLLMGITFINKFFNLNASTLPVDSNDVTLLSYNVRLFNKFKWYTKSNIPKQIAKFIQEKNPDILCIQEYSSTNATQFDQYPYKYIHKEGKNIIVGNAIFSKYKILNKGKISFPNSNNNVVFADLLIKEDTVRVYSMHLQSIKISTDIDEENIENIDESKTKRIYNRISKAFLLQQEQAELIHQHYLDYSNKKIVCGDLNNSAFSYVYRKVKSDMQDGFETNGKGFGKTYDFKYYPARIDYVFLDKKIRVKEFSTLNDFYNSDHFPLKVRFAIN